MSNTQKLTDSNIKQLKPKDKMYSVADSITGLRLFIYPTGKQVWRLTFSFEGKNQSYTIGSYPAYTLADARQEALTLRTQIEKGINPCQAKKQDKIEQTINATTFGNMFNDWFESKKVTWSKVHIDDQLQKYNTYIAPYLAQKPITQITRKDIELALQTIIDQQKAPTLKKVRSIISQVTQYAQMKDFDISDYTPLFRNMGLAHTVKNRACLTSPKKVAHLMVSIECYRDISLITYIALKFSAYTFCRPGEIRHAEWSEFDFEESIWRIPAEKMKMKKPHLVPLSKQMLDLLYELKPLTGHLKYLFPKNGNINECMSEACILSALRRMGFSKDEMSAHGFRGMASTILNEQGYNHDWIEIQLAHTEKNSVRSAYNHAQYLPQRREMIQAYNDYLDNLARKVKNIISNEVDEITIRRM